MEHDWSLSLVLIREKREKRKKREGRKGRRKKGMEGRRGKRMSMKQKRPRVHGTEHEVGIEAGFPDHP